jgi:hypothetical protein
MSCGSWLRKTALLPSPRPNLESFTRSNEPLARGLQNKPIRLQVDRPEFAICEIRISHGGKARQIFAAFVKLLATLSDVSQRFSAPSSKGSWAGPTLGPPPYAIVREKNKAELRRPIML